MRQSCASLASAKLVRATFLGSPRGRACRSWIGGTLLCRGDSRGRSTARRPSPATGPNKKILGDENRLDSGSHISEIHKKADSPAVERIRSGQGSSTILRWHPASSSEATFVRQTLQIEKSRIASNLLMWDGFFASKIL